MKKIKSKLIYVNPSYRPGQRADRSPSPDGQHRSSILRTESPTKQVEQFYRIKHSINQFCSEIQKSKQMNNGQNNKGEKLPSKVKNVSGYFSVNQRQEEQLSMQSISQGIKLKSPSSSFYHTSNNKNHVYMTPKSKNQSSISNYHSHTSNKDQFPVSSLEWSNHSDYGKLIKSMESSEYGKMINDSNHSGVYESPVRSNKKSKKKLEVLSPGMREKSKEKGEMIVKMNESLNMSNQKYYQTPTLQHPSPKDITEQSYKIQPPSNQKKKTQRQVELLLSSSRQKDIQIQKMARQLSEKQEQLKKMSVYVKQYEQLGEKNKRMEQEMGEILRKLVEMKAKQEEEKEMIRSESMRISRRSLYNGAGDGDNDNEHNQNGQRESYQSKSVQDNHFIQKPNPFLKPHHPSNYTSNPHLLTDNNSISQQLPQSQIQQQNYHTRNSHKKTFTDEYIKIYDQIDSLNNSRNNIQEQEQSYKPNLFSKNNQHQQNNKKQVQFQNSNERSRSKQHRKMGSVGARLKQSLKAKNEQFVASFDDSLLMNSSSSSISISNINTYRTIQSGTNLLQGEENKTIQVKKLEHLKTEETEGDSLPVMIENHDTFHSSQQEQLEEQLAQQADLQSFVQEKQLSERNQSGLQSLNQQSPSFQQIKRDSASKQLTEEQTTVKKPKLKYVIRKKTEQQSTDQNIDNLIQTNRQLTLIVKSLVNQQETILNQLLASIQKHQTASYKMSQFQNQFVHLHQDLTKLMDLSQQKEKHLFNGPQNQLYSALQSIQQRVYFMSEQLSENNNSMKVQERENKQWVESNSHKLRKSLPLLTKVSSFGKLSNQNNNNPHQITLFQNPSNSKISRQDSHNSSSNQQSPGSPSFTYLQDTGSFLTQSFKLSQTDRSNPSHSKFNHYSTNVQNEYMAGVNHPDYNMNETPSKRQPNQKVNRYENSAILINEYSSSESNLLNSSKNTSQFINQVNSGRSMGSQRQKSIASKTSKDFQNSKIRSSNSQVRINFDDLYQEASKQYHFEIVNREANHNNEGPIQETNKPKSIELMKSSFGPIILQNEMSYSQKGESVIGESRDHVSEDGLVNHQDVSPRVHNRPRENSSINIFFSSDSICKSTPKHNNLTPKNYASPSQTSGVQFQNPSRQAPYSSQSSGRSSYLTAQKCQNCQLNIEKITSLETQANQMRKMISEITGERDGLKKLIKSKVEMIDRLEISLKEVQSLSSLENIKSLKDIQASNSHHPTFNYEITNNDKPQKQSPLWYKSVNEFQYLPQPASPPVPSSTSSYLKSKKMNQIQDVLAISAQLQTQNLPLDKIQSLRSIELEIHEELKKEKELQGFGQNRYFYEEGKPIDWGKGSFSNVEELREKSFSKTKTILLKLICLIRQLITEGNQHLTN